METNQKRDRRPGLVVELAVALVLLVAGGAVVVRLEAPHDSYSTSVPASWTSVGPVALAEPRNDVERALGQGTKCDRTAECYSDGRAFLRITYAQDAVSEVFVSERPPMVLPSTALQPGTVGTWTWDGSPVLGHSYVVPDPSWRPAIDEGRSKGFVFGGYEAVQSYTEGTGWIVALYHVGTRL